MTSHSLANVFGWIVLLVVLMASVFYGPLGQFGKPKPAQAVQPSATTPAAPVPRGPVIKEVPN
jgi:energy-converting hydrogenase Eha subunit F